MILVDTTLWSLTTDENTVSFSWLFRVMGWFPKELDLGVHSQKIF
jgi:hypothetical protein